jgi:putative oxidoreductase
MTTTQVTTSKALHITLWVAQGILAAFFLMVGYTKLATPIDELSQIIPMASELPLLTRFIGLSEILGGVGLILPAALRIKPALTTLAAIALALVMVLAAIFHISRGEVSAIGTNIVLFSVAAFIGWGRSMKARITAKV